MYLNIRWGHVMYFKISNVDLKGESRAFLQDNLNDPIVKSNSNKPRSVALFDFEPKTNWKYEIYGNKGTDRYPI